MIESPTLASVKVGSISSARLNVLIALLNLPWSYAMVESSLDPSTCWNLAPPSTRYVDACLYYLGQFEPEPRAFRIKGLAEKSS